MITDLTRIITGGTDVAFSCNGTINLAGDLEGLPDLNLPYNFNGKTKLKK
jgi:hypothetical protein